MGDVGKYERARSPNDDVMSLARLLPGCVKINNACELTHSLALSFLASAYLPSLQVAHNGQTHKVGWVSTAAAGADAPPDSTLMRA